MLGKNIISDVTRDFESSRLSKNDFLESNTTLDLKF